MREPTAEARKRMVRERAPVALLMVDVINDLSFPGGVALAAQTGPFIRSLSALKRRAVRAGIPAIYVNDNFGRWRSDLHHIVAHCGRPKSRGCDMVRRLRPTSRDYFVLKPRHSGFHSSALDRLLQYLETKTIIITGIAGDNCVLFTAADAHMRDLRLIIPMDCTLSVDPASNLSALSLLHTQLGADLTASTALDLRRVTADAQD